MEVYLIMSSKTKQAIDWINGAPGRTQYAAARMFGISQSALSVAMKRQTHALYMWEKWGEAITTAEQTGDKSHLRGITTADHSAAMRGRALAGILPEALDGRMQYKLSPGANALDWLIVNGRTVMEAAQKFDINTSSIYQARTLEKDMLQAYERIGADKVDKIAAWLDAHQLKTPAETAHWFEHSISRIRAALTMRATLRRRSTMQPDATEFDYGYKCGRAETIKQCAQMARLLGGDIGETLAQAIEGIK